MKLFIHIIAFIISLLFMVAALFLSIYSFGLTAKTILPNLLTIIYLNWQAGFIFLALFVVGALGLYPYFVSTAKRTTLIRDSELGDVNITLAAMSNLIKERVLEEDDIIDVKLKLAPVPDGLKINLRGKVKVSTDIPHLTEKIQVELKDYIEITTGVQVYRIQILIEDIDKNQLPINLEEE